MEATSPIKLLPLAFLSVLFLLSAGDITPRKVDARAPGCNGSIAECSEEAEFQMDSEINRRLLEQKKYISPGALKRDQPVCKGGGSGDAYSKSGDCLPSPSNPETRGCAKYYRCRSDS
ncbi:protein RALF-like 32 [Rhodamnia argentea]|uniref:Protein RALF-like 32 n=1 Tax=Rhodamnia argentea TaxID=178133 RepID=A0ABM3H3P6_9MYRT|nr:protein RALF-like 32 [Rhodamnia argentea]